MIIGAKVAKFTEFTVEMAILQHLCMQQGGVCMFMCEV